MKKSTILFYFLITLVVFTGCSLNKIERKENLNPIDITVQENQLYKTPTGDAKDKFKLTKVWEVYKISEDFRPIIEGNDVYALSTEFCSIDRQTGKINWSTNLSSDPIDKVCFKGNFLTIGSMDEISYLDKKTGKCIWNFKSQKEIYAVPIEKDGVIYFTASEGILYAVEINNGKEKWRYNYNDGTPVTMEILSNPVIVGNEIFYSSGLMNNFYAVDMDIHKLNWKIDKLEINNEKLLTEGTNVYLVSSNGVIYAFDVINRKIKWSKNLNNDVDPGCTIKNGHMYLYGLDGHIYCVSLNSGNIKFDYTFNNKSGIGDICVTDELVYFTTFKDLASIDLNGENYKTYNLDSCSAKRVVKYEDEIYITTTDNKLIKYLISK